MKEYMKGIPSCLQQGIEISDSYSYILPFELWENVFYYLDFKSQLRMQEVCKNFNGLKIYKIPDDYSYLLTDEILKKYVWLTELHVYDNPHITNLNHITNLKILNVGGCFNEINDDGIKNLTNLIKLSANNNPYITNVNHMINLKELNARYCCGIDYNGIKDLELVKLDATDNPKITDKKYMQKIINNVAEVYNYNIIHYG
jgi:hypothetical protein